MTIFEALIDSLFKRTDRQWEFFPYSIGVGFKITSEAQYRAVRDAISRYLLRTLAILVAVAVIVGWPIVFALWPGLILFYVCSIRNLTLGLTRLDKNLTFAESLRLQAVSYKAWMLWCIQATSLLFTGLGIVLLAASPPHWFVGLLATVVFGLGSVFTAYTLHTKARLAGAEGVLLQSVPTQDEAIRVVAFGG